MRRARRARTSRRRVQPGVKAARLDAEGDAFMRDLRHPLKADIERVRHAVLAAVPNVTDGVKWNALSFRTTDWFATVNLRSRDRVQIVLHLGAKVKSGTRNTKVEDPRAMLTWLAKDRCLLTLPRGPAAPDDLRAVAAIVRQWVAHVR